MGTYINFIIYQMMLPKEFTECLFNTMFMLPVMCQQKFTIYFLPISQACHPIRAGTGVGALHTGPGAQPCTPVASTPTTASH